MKEIFKLFFTSNGSNLIAGYYEGDFDMIFHFKAAKNLVSEHFEIDFFFKFPLLDGSNLIAEYYEGDFDMIFPFMAAKNLVAEYYEIDF